MKQYILLCKMKRTVLFYDVTPSYKFAANIFIAFKG